MSTLGVMKAEIADDLDRTDLTDQIATAIERAIRRYRDRPFWLVETRNLLITTVANQSSYTTLDAGSAVTSVADISRIEEGWIVENGNAIRMDWMPPDEWEDFSDTTASISRPVAFTRFENAIRVYPIPLAGDLMRFHGFVRRSAPAADDETGNIWMTDAYDLIKAEAVYWLAVHKTRDDRLAAIMRAEANNLLNDLYAESSRIMGAGRIEACV